MRSNYKKELIKFARYFEGKTTFEMKLPTDIPSCCTLAVLLDDRTFLALVSTFT